LNSRTITKNWGGNIQFEGAHLGNVKEAEVVLQLLCSLYIYIFMCIYIYIYIYNLLHNIAHNHYVDGQKLFVEIMIF